MSRGGAANKRSAGSGNDSGNDRPPATSSGRITAKPDPTAGPRTNWLAVVVVVLVLIGLVGGFFVSLVAGGGSTTTTLPVTSLPPTTLPVTSLPVTSLPISSLPPGVPGT